MNKPFVVWFEQVGKEDIPLVGGKGANLGEMTQADIPVPPGFIVTAPAYFHFLTVNNLGKKIRDEIEKLNYNDPHSLNQVSTRVKKLITDAPMPEDLAVQILKMYHELGNRDQSKYHQKNHHETPLLKSLHKSLEEPLVAVRSSATAEDLPTASFAGQQATFLNVQGDVDLLNKVREAYASLFEARAIFYREENKFDHFKVGIATPVQRMVQSEISGVMFTIDPITNLKTKITVEAVLGLGEMIVQGSVTPDHYELDKKDLSILTKQVNHQTVMLVKEGKGNKEKKVPNTIADKQKLSDELIREVASIGKRIEHHYFFPQDIEWAVEDKKVFIVQTRPITTMKATQSVTDSAETQNELAELIKNPKNIIATGSPASPGIASGPVKVILSASEISKIKPGDVLVAPQTNPDYVPAMKKASAIVTDQGGRTSHAAIVSRELGIPAVVGTTNGTKVLKNDQIITVNGATGEVFKGGLTKGAGTHLGVFQTEEEKKHHESVQKLQTATKVYINLAEPERAPEVSKLHVEGIGLLRAEFILAQIGTHPKEIIKQKKQKEFIDTLADNLKVFCENFSPRPVVYRFSDFKTNEYRNLKGGAAYEPHEENPMIGFRGAYRYIKDPSSFEMEVEAIKKVRNTYGFKNLWVMIPFVRTVDQLLEVKKLLSSFGLHRSPSFRLWMMVEVPTNVILLDEYIDAGIDGVSIGSNDLTMLTLGVDRDNNELAEAFSEMDPAVLALLEKVVKTCHKHKITASLCGQAASTYPELVEKLVEWGITSVSVSPDAVDTVRESIYKAELKKFRR